MVTMIKLACSALNRKQTASGSACAVVLEIFEHNTDSIISKFL